MSGIVVGGITVGSSIPADEWVKWFDSPCTKRLLVRLTEMIEGEKQALDRARAEHAAAFPDHVDDATKAACDGAMATGGQRALGLLQTAIEAMRPAVAFDFAGGRAPTDSEIAAVKAAVEEHVRLMPQPRGIVTDRRELDTTIGPDGMQRNYLVLPDEERAKGFVRPVREKYVHVGIAGPKNAMVDIQPGMVGHGDFAKLELGDDGQPDRYWTADELAKVDKGCGAVTRMNRAIAETYARNPSYYGATYCVGCGTHLPVGAKGEFVWDGTNERVGT